MRNISVFSLVLILTICIIFPAFSQQETITITTYYPAPFGVYQNLRLFPTTTIPNCAADNDEGVMYYDNTINQLRVCRQTGTMPDTFDWQNAGSLWTLGGIRPNQFIYPSDTNWNVGIGTNNPLREFHVRATDTNSGNANILLEGVNFVDNSTTGVWNIRAMGIPSAGSPAGYAGRLYITSWPSGTMFGATDPVVIEEGAANNSLYINTAGNVGIGTTSPNTPAPNSQPGNLDVNDIWLRAANGGSGQWLSQGGGGGCYVSYSHACLTGFTNKGSPGWWGYCSGYYGSAFSSHFRPPGGGCRSGWLSNNIGEAFVCCQ